MIKSRAVDDDKMIIICFEFIVSLLLYFSLFLYISKDCIFSVTFPLGH